MSSSSSNDPSQNRQTFKIRLGRWLTEIRILAGQIARKEAFRRLCLGLPALLTGLGLVLGLPLLRTNPTEIRHQYEQAAAQAQRDRDAATAAVCLDRLSLLKQQSGPISAESVERLARLALDLGQLDRADVLLAEVAPEDRPGTAPAHLTRALLLLRSPGPGRGIPRADRLRAERHLRQALALDPDLAPAHEILGRIALQDGDLPQAEGHMQQAARANPALNYQVALVMEREGRPETAAFWARQARDYFARVSDKEPDNHAARIGWASSEILLGDYAAARTVLTRGLARADLREYHQVMARSYLAEAAALVSKGNVDPGSRLILLEGALQHDPGDSSLIEQLSATLKGNEAEADQVREQLQSALARGQAVTTAHLLLGYDAWEHKRFDEARLHWESALKASPKSAVVANNLAWALATGPKPDLARALSLIDSVLELEPNQPSLLSTRGRILVGMGRWKEALAALEAALPAQPDNRELHKDLATAYTALKAPELAERHRRLAEPLPP